MPPLADHIKQASQSVHGGNAYTSLKRSDVDSPWESTYTIHDGNFFTALFASSAVDVSDVVARVQRCGRIKSGTRMSVSATVGCVGSALLDMLTDDAIDCITANLTDVRDLQSVANLRCTCRALAPAARGALARLSRPARVEALLYGTLPEEAKLPIERDAAAALLAGNELDTDLTAALFALARKAVASRPSAWTLSAEAAETDPANDLSFKLLGFGTASVANGIWQGTLPTGQPASAEPQREPQHHAGEDGSEASREGSVTTRRLHALPCVLGGPPRYLALSGSARQQRAVRQVPLEQCRITRAPTPAPGDHEHEAGVELVTAMLQCAASA